MTTLALVFLFVAISGGDQQVDRVAPIVKPSNVEEFMSRPTTQMSWTSEVETISSVEARATLSAFVASDEASPSRQIRGLRIDVADGTGTDRIYIEDSRVEAVRRALLEIAETAARNQSRPPLVQEGTDQTRVVGSALLRQQYPTKRDISAGYYFAPDSSGLTLSAYGGRQFRFPGVNPRQLVAAIERGTTALNQAPRPF